MDEIGIDLEAEIARVRDELVAFRDVCLPAFFGRGGIPDAATTSKVENLPITYCYIRG
jgi:hypothetical protein